MTTNWEICRPIVQNRKTFFLLSDTMDLRHQSSGMYNIMWGGKTHTRCLQRKEESLAELLQWTC